MADATTKDTVEKCKYMVDELNSVFSELCSAGIEVKIDADILEFRQIGNGPSVALVRLNVLYLERL